MSRFTRWSKTFVPGDRVLTQYRFHGERRQGVVDSVEGEYVLVKLRYNHKGETIAYITEAYRAELELIE